MVDKCERCGASVEYALMCDACNRELFGSGNCSRCGAPNAPFIGLGPIGSDDPDGDDYFCDDCNDEMLAVRVRRTEPEPPGPR
jgi:hypothetical protein